MAEKKGTIIEDLASLPGVTKSGLASALQKMHSRGILNTNIGSGSTTAVRKRLSSPLKDLRNAQSPYGPLLRHVPTVDGSTVEIVNPHAYMFHMANISAELGDLLFDVSAGGTRVVRIVLYMDSICPGNPLRPDKSRTTECVYWTIVDFPDHILVSTLGWFVFSTMRRTTIEDSMGGPSVFMAMTMKQFWSADTDRPNFEKGVLIDCHRRAFLLRASFAGFLSDEKALK